MNTISQDVENKLYTQVADEIESNEIDRGVYAKAPSESKGDKKEAEALYIKFRVEQLKFEIEKSQIAVMQEYKEVAKNRNRQSLEVSIYTFIILLIVISLLGSVRQ